MYIQNPSMLTTLVYSEIKAYSEACQISEMEHFIKKAIYFKLLLIQNLSVSVLLNPLKGHCTHISTAFIFLYWRLQDLLMNVLLSFRELLNIWFQESIIIFSFASKVVAQGSLQKVFFFHFFKHACFQDVSL